jgi:hypothetical protein
VNLVLGKWAQVFSPRDLCPWFSGLRYWSMVVRLYLLCHHLPGLVFSDSEHTLTTRTNRQQSKHICPPALTTHMRPTHKDSSPARTAMPSHMPRAYPRFAWRVATSTP